MSASPFERLLQNCCGGTPLNFHPLFSYSSSPIHLPIEKTQEKVLFGRVSKMLCPSPIVLCLHPPAAFAIFLCDFFFTLVQNKKISYTFLKESCQHSTKVIYAFISVKTFHWTFSMDYVLFLSGCIIKSLCQCDD